MEALPTIHHHHQNLCSSLHYCCPSLTQSTYCSLLRSPPAASSPPPSPSIRASSSPSPPSSDPPPQNLQFPEPNKSPQLFNPLPKVSFFDPSEPERSTEFFNPLRVVPSLATITAASAFLFLGFCRNGFIHRPVTLTTLSSVETIQESLDEKSDLEEFPGSKPCYLRSILHLKLEEKVPIAHSFNKTRTDDDEAWQVLKAQVLRCGEQLELVRIGFEEILENDRDCNKANQDRVLEYLELVDKCRGLLKGIKLAMDRCERENGDLKLYLRLLSKVVARIRVFEGDMVGALKHLKEIEQE